MNEGYRAWGALQRVNRGPGIKAKKGQYEGVIVPTALNGAEAWGMKRVERSKVNVLERKCLRSLNGVSRMDRVRNEEVRRSAGISINQSKLYSERNITENIKIFLKLYKIKTDLLTCHQDLVRRGCY